MPDPALSSRCASCDINWPTGTNYARCPKCEQPTDGCFLSPDMPFSQAQQRKAAWEKWRVYDRQRPSKVTTEACRVHCTCILCIKSREIRKALNA